MRPDRVKLEAMMRIRCMVTDPWILGEAEDMEEKEIETITRQIAEVFRLHRIILLEEEVDTWDDQDPGRLEATTKAQEEELEVAEAPEVDIEAESIWALIKESTIPEHTIMSLLEKALGFLIRLLVTKMSRMLKDRALITAIEMTSQHLTRAEAPEIVFLTNWTLRCVKSSHSESSSKTSFWKKG